MVISMSRLAAGAAVALFALAGASASASAHRAHGARHAHHQHHHARVYSSYEPAYVGYRSWRRPVIVDAPYTYVETGWRRRVAVDAPFTAVRVYGRGVWVRAPFVNLWAPR